MASLWSYESQSLGPDRRLISRNRDGSNEFRLELSDPLLNTVLPGTGVSLVINFGDPWVAGRSLMTAALLPRVCVVGPVTQARILRVGKSVRATGVCFSAERTRDLFGVPASELVDSILPLADLWPQGEVERLFDSLAARGIANSVCRLKDEIVERGGEATLARGIGHASAALIKLRRGIVSVGEMARENRVSRREFGRKFTEVSGIPPKLFARITRFQALVHTLLSTDVSQWAGVSSSAGFHDQAHMINEFRTFTGSPPTVFFRPHGAEGPNTSPILPRGRPSEWLYDK